MTDYSVSLSELAQGERPNISLKLVSSFRLRLALGPSLPAGLEACRAVACKHRNINQYRHKARDHLKRGRRKQLEIFILDKFGVERLSFVQFLPLERRVAQLNFRI